jgi:hypothetical protein
MDNNWIAIGNGNYIRYEEDMVSVVGEKIAKILLEVYPTELRGRLLEALIKEKN